MNVKIDKELLKKSANNVFLNLEKGIPIKDSCKIFNISRTSFYKQLSDRDKIRIKQIKALTKARYSQRDFDSAEYNIY